MGRRFACKCSLFYLFVHVFLFFSFLFCSFFFSGFSMNLPLYHACRPYSTPNGRVGRQIKAHMSLLPGARPPSTVVTR